MLAVGFALSGCARNTLVLAGVVPVQTLPPGVCTKPADGLTLYPPPAAIGFKAIGHSFPPQAMAAGIRIGCAGVVFRIDAAGKVVDARVTSEFPEGYGFGVTGLSDLEGTSFPPGVADPNWHFTRTILRWTGPARGQSPTGAPATPAPAGTVKPWGLMG